MANPDAPAALSPFAVALAGSLSLAVAMGIGRFAFTPMLPLMIQAGQLDVGRGGWLAAANYAGYLAGAVTAARLPLSAPRLAGVALLLTAALTAAMALPGPPQLWMALRFAAGAASAWAFVSTGVWCLGSLARMNSSSMGSGVYAGVGAGIALAGLYAWLMAWAGQTAASLWLQLGAWAALLALPVLAVVRRLGVPQAPRAAAADGKARPPAGTAAVIVCYGLPGFWLNGWTVALSALCVGGTFMVVTLIGVQEIRARAVGDPTPWVSRLVAAFALGQIAGPVASSLLLHTPAAGERGLAVALQAAALALLASAAWLWRHNLSKTQPEALHAH